MTPSRREGFAVVPEADEAAYSFGQLASALWHEREILQRLLYRLCAQRSLLSESAFGWLPESDREVREAIHALELTEIARSAQAEQLAGRYGLPVDASLAMLASVAPEPWPSILTDHRDALRRLEGDARDVAACTSRELRAAFALDIEQDYRS